MVIDTKESSHEGSDSDGMDRRTVEEHDDSGARSVTRQVGVGAHDSWLGLFCSGCDKEVKQFFLVAIGYTRCRICRDCIEHLTYKFANILDKA